MLVPDRIELGSVEVDEGAGMPCREVVRRCRGAIATMSARHELGPAQRRAVKPDVARTRPRDTTKLGAPCGDRSLEERRRAATSRVESVVPSP